MEMKRLLLLIPLFHCLILLMNTTYTIGDDCCCNPVEEYFCLYTYERWDGANATDVLSASANTANGFGQIRSDDWDLLAGPGTTAKVIGRVQGQHTLYNNNLWNAAFTIVFQDDKYKGSTLQVRGEWDQRAPEPPIEWSILGGTGRFTLAQGIIYANTVPTAGSTERRMKLCFQVFYHPIAKPSMA